MNSLLRRRLNLVSVPLEDRYSVEVDGVSKDEWYKIIDQFSDANIFQTWSYDAVRCGEKNISHLILREAGKVIAAAQARIVRISFLGLGAAYVRWGPLWQLPNETSDPAVFRFALRALRTEYVCRRGMILRIFPLLYDDNCNSVIGSLRSEFYTPAPNEDRGRTLIVDISAPLDEIRRQLTERWRRCLKKAEKGNLEIIEGTDDKLFAEFIGIYRDMLRRKEFPEPNDINEFRMIQKELAGRYKMRIMLCLENGMISAGGIFVAVGETGVYLFGATNAHGMKNNGSYLVHWKAIEWMKESGCRYYNLYGINPERNPGTYVFKGGLAGKKGKDVYYLGRFDCYPGSISRALAHTGDLVFPFLRKIKASFSSHNTNSDSGQGGLT